MKTIAFALLLAAAIPTPAVAQLRIETGGGEAHLDQLPSSSLASLGGSLETWLPHFHLDLSGAGQDHAVLGTAGMVHAAASAAYATGAWSFTAGPIFDGARDVAMPWTTAWGGNITVDRTIGRFSVGAGLQLGLVKEVFPDATHDVSWRQPSIRAGYRIGGFDLNAAWKSTMLPDTSVDTPSQVTDTLNSARALRQVSDLSAGLGWSWHLVSISGQVGRRYGNVSLPMTWWNTSALVHLTPTVALNASVGRSPTNILLATRGAQFTTIGLRFDIARLRPADDVRHATAAATAVQRESPSTIRVTFALPSDVRNASVASDLTQWEPVPLTRGAHGRWTTELKAGAGTWRINIRTNDGAWEVPPGIPASDDGFGNQVGLLVVE